MRDEEAHAEELRHLVSDVFRRSRAPGDAHDLTEVEAFSTVVLPGPDRTVPSNPWDCARDCKQLCDVVIGAPGEAGTFACDAGTSAEGGGGGSGGSSGAGSGGSSGGSGSGSGSSSGGSGSGGGSGSSSGGPPTSCVATFSGVFGGSVNPCSVEIVWEQTTNQWTVQGGGTAIAGAPYTWSGFRIQLAGTPATGTFGPGAYTVSQSDITTQAGMLQSLEANGTSVTTTEGTMTVTLTDTGTFVPTGNGGALSLTPHGSLTATLVPVPSGPSESVAVTF